MFDLNTFRRLPLATAIIGISLCLPFTLACFGRTMLRGDGVTEQEKRIILDVHNRMRQAVALGQIDGQPPASNMIEMKWDNELAAKAQQWAVSCSASRHDAYRHIDRFLVGQNTATTWTTKTPTDYYELESDFPGAIHKWFDEVRKFRFGKQSHPGAGHYAQMIWANTNLIGCGYSFYHSPERGFTKYYVCNYGPSGNVDGESPYRKGYPSCYEFGLENSRKYAGLCDKPGSIQTTPFFTFHNFIG
ncbi:venom allergen 5-like [Harmonia axyridis]|uniref:venom allergen 5-like n=1 Tax=Harmonia axyridis TaxID=115357 RepID=UPI001E275B36|nr:venom allergen 5-like [Harmonia axyridis]